MGATKTLTAALQKQVLLLEDDLRARVESDAATRGRWVMEHDRATTRGRTASSWQAWRDDRVTQAAVAWVLATVFVRFCEDNALVGSVWIAGPEQRRQEALDAQLAFFRTHPEDTDREWLLDAVEHLRSLRATAALVDEHSPLWQVAPSGDAASALLTFWRRRGDDGALVHDFTDPALGTRFLGDLYQDLSEHAKATYALLQTPVFVEEFILDRTLTPALAERPLEGFRLIDPTCGSGHFLLGAFDRLLDRWHREAPGLDLQARVQTALDAIHGVDLNPFAIAIARFRLTVAALRACGQHSLTNAPAFHFHLAVGDSLLHGPQQTLHGDTDLSTFAYTTEDVTSLSQILRAGRYDAVLGNPPYIFVGDRVLRQAYRDRYSSCLGTYALTVPFMERFFDLAKSATNRSPAGWVGQITSNSFMKRKFGKRLIEDFLSKVDISQILNSEGAWIPGHNMDGTPTVIIIGKAQPPTRQTIRVALSQGRRETRMSTSGTGPYWSGLTQHIDEPGWESDWVTIADLSRDSLAHYPWSLSGGAASSLLARLSLQGVPLGSKVRRVGMFGDSHAEDLFAAPAGVHRRLGVDSSDLRPAVSGNRVRDWTSAINGTLMFPTESSGSTNVKDLTRHALWPWRTSLWGRATFAGESYRAAGKDWLSWHQVSVSDSKLPHIVFAKITSRNHFSRGVEGRIEKPSALRIELPPSASPSEYLALLAILNSSTAWFWLKENSQPKGGAAQHLWSRTYELSSATLKRFPVARGDLSTLSRELDSLARACYERQPETLLSSELPSAHELDAARQDFESARRKMYALQEELDWRVYQLYGLCDSELCYEGSNLPPLTLGERAFEIILARSATPQKNENAWFEEHHSTPLTNLPSTWPEAYRQVVARRLEGIATNATLRLLEGPEHKRRWELDSWESRLEQSLKRWLLKRLEDENLWTDTKGRPTPRSIAQLSDLVERDMELVGALALWEGRPDVPVTQTLLKLLANESVPYLAAHRYTDSGLRKRQGWNLTWELQRKEDVGEGVEMFAGPPPYEENDFQDKGYWQMRGKLDVPKERFILYPDAGRAGDPTPLLGWAGWDHAQQSLALSVIITARETDGWSDERLVPLVAGLAELQPWVDQWYAEVDPTYGVSLAAFCREQLTSRTTQVNKTPADLAAWRPDSPTRGRKPRGAGRGAPE